MTRPTQPGQPQDDPGRQVEEFIAIRHGLGYRSVSQERALRAFGRYLSGRGQCGPIPLQVSLDWATASTSTDPVNPARRLSVIRTFLRHRAGIDGATQVPVSGLLGSTGRRKPPHVYSDEEIGALLSAAARLSPSGGLRPRCYVTLFGLLACTGLRISEALALTCDDVDLAEAMLTVQAGKRGRTRLVPLHPTTVAALEEYATARARVHGPPHPDETFLRTDRHERVSYEQARHAFIGLRKRLGWTAVGRTRAPRIHDLRHRMAVRRIQSWHTEGVNVDAKLPLLATYLGHVEVRGLYWYLTAVPELMGIIAERFETFAADTTGGA